MIEPVRVIGVISGTSVDGVDVALVETDGVRILARRGGETFAYRGSTAAAVLAAVDAGGRPSPQRFAELSRDVEDDHVAAVRAFAARRDLDLASISALGFHGQTIFHDPAAGITSQLGDPARVARLLGVPVVGRLREADMAAGGQGAPIVPVYHAALAEGWTKPLAFLNAGGVANLTYVGEAEVIARDVGPANGPLDDWVRRRVGASHDEGGALALAGRSHDARVEAALAHPALAEGGPLALDRNAFSWRLAEGLSTEDGAATLVEIAAAAVAVAAMRLPRPPRRWLVCGGGRRNAAYMRALERRLAAPVEPVEAEGLDGDAIEAEAMAFIAARSLAGLPVTFPGTTGCRAPTLAGRLFRP